MQKLDTEKSQTGTLRPTQRGITEGLLDTEEDFVAEDRSQPTAVPEPMR